MYQIIAFRESYTPNPGAAAEVEEDWDVVATFDTKEMAKAYIKKSKLKTTKKSTWNSDMPFREKSLLGGWSWTEIEPVPVPDPMPPHNPEM